MIKDSKINPVSISIMTNNIQANPISGPSPISPNPSARPLRTALRRLAAAAALLLGIAMTANSQSVIMNGNNFLTHNEAGTTVSTTATTTFNPATCL